MIAGAFLQAGLVDEVVGYVRAAVLGAGSAAARPAGRRRRSGDLRPFRLVAADVVGERRADPDDGAPPTHDADRAGAGRGPSPGGAARAATAATDAALTRAATRSGERIVLVGPDVALRARSGGGRVPAPSRRPRPPGPGTGCTGTSIPSSSSSSAWSRWPRRRRSRRCPASGTDAIAPSIASGAGAGIPSALHSRSRASRAIDRFAAMRPAQPSSWRPPTNRIAAGSVSHGRRVERARPVEREPEPRTGPLRSLFAPWDVDEGPDPRPGGRRGRGAGPTPFGAHSHLWPLPVQYAALSALDVAGDHARGVRAVDERVDAPPVELADDRDRPA